MSYHFYKVLHFLGLIMVFVGLGGLAVVGQVADPKPLRRILSILHGLGMLLLIVAGFGLIAKLKVDFGGWLSIKLVIWLALGGALALLKRKADMAKVWLLVLPVLGLVAAVLGVYKPF